MASMSDTKLRWFKNELAKPNNVKTKTCCVLYAL